MSIKVATVFSGIGAPEQALEQLGVKYDIVFACDNGERKISATVEKEAETHLGEGNAVVNDIITQGYIKASGENLVQRTYMANYSLPPDHFFQDVRYLDGKEFRGQVDLFIGGSPCQSFSVMGKRGGLEEARGTLFYEYARLVDEICPKVFIYENVPGKSKADDCKNRLLGM